VNDERRAASGNPGNRRFRRFVVVASPRTGSTLLVRSLDSSPHVLCAGELFHHGKRVYHREFQYARRRFGRRAISRIVDVLARRPSPEQHLRSFYERAESRYAAAGFKLMIAQAGAYPTVVPFLRDHGVFAFHVCRRNVFDAALSYYRAKLSGLYHSDDARRGTGSPAITADEDEFRRLLDVCAANNRRIRELHAQLGGRILAYEDMTADWESFISAVGSELGLPDLKVPKALEKVDSTIGAASFTNEEALRQKYARYESGDDGT